MKFKRAALLGTTILAGSLIASAALAQTQTTTAPSEDEAATEVTQIVVTGSRIRRDVINSPMPLTQVQREELLETGLASMVDYLATIPALSNSLVPSDTTGSLNIAGVSAANLRTLGTDRVLTLIDGRRQVGAQVGRLLVDIDTIPRLLIQNIDIITGGASSIYGADAVSGVLNYNLRKDFEGIELDVSMAQLAGDTDEPPVRERVSFLAGKNLFDDRLNVYGFAEWEKYPRIDSSHLSWLRDGRTVIGVDTDPSAVPSDGFVDNALFYDVKYVGRPVWGVTTIANSQQPSPTSNPLIPLGNCTGFTSANCFSVSPDHTYWYDNGKARLVNLGQRLGTVGLNRPYNIGGDGVNSNTYFGGNTATPKNDSLRFQTGANYKVTDNISAYVEAKYVTEDSYLLSQPSFFDIYISNTYSANGVQPLSGSSAFFTRADDNAFLPDIIRQAMLTNQVVTWGAPTANAPGAAGATTSANFARHVAFGVPRSQENSREVQRYVLALKGERDKLGFLSDVGWDVSYVFGQLDNLNTETGMDSLRTSLAQDAVYDHQGLVNGKAGEIVCRAQLLAARGLTVWNYSGNLDDTRDRLTAADPEIKDCKPLNVFGDGNQSAEAIDYITASIFLDERNRQQNVQASLSGQTIDLTGAGSIGLAVGAEWRKEEAQGLGRSASTNGRYLQLNTGGDFLHSAYEAREAFGEVSLPLLKESRFGDFAELSASYRYFDYTHMGTGDVWGVNLVYRPIPDITFKSSFNTSFRAPNLNEVNGPIVQTFANGFVDPCDTRQIQSANRTPEERANRIKNCTALASAKGLNFDFNEVTATNAYLPTYSSGIAGVNAGNPELEPETSESFTFSVVLEPRFIRNLSVLFDYYDIRIDNVIASVSAQTLANQCVNNASLDEFACSRIFRETGKTTTDSEAFMVGGTLGHPIGGFRQVSMNYAKREVRGIDFKARYGFGLEDLIGIDLGSITWDLNGSYLIEQKNFTSFTDPSVYTAYEGTLYYPRVRLTNRLSWRPNADLSMTWAVDWQSSQPMVLKRSVVSSGNLDTRPVSEYETGGFARHDFTVRYNINDDLLVRGTVTNIFNNSQHPWLGSDMYSNFDPYGRRFMIGLSYSL